MLIFGRWHKVSTKKDKDRDSFDGSREYLLTTNEEMCWETPIVSDTSMFKEEIISAYFLVNYGKF